MKKNILLVFVSALFLATNSQDVNLRIDCFPEQGATLEKCMDRKCLYDPTDYYIIKAPQCYYPNNTGYIRNSDKLFSSGETNFLTLKKSPDSVPNPFGDDFDELIFSWESIGAGLHVTISPNQTRYRPPISITANPNIISDDKLNLVPSPSQNTSIFSFQISRKSNGANIWDTSIGGLLFSDKFLQIATKLPSDKIYGFGENIHWQIQHNLTRYTTWGMFALDNAPDSENFNTRNLYGVHPFYLGLEPDGSAHGVFILNSNAMEVTTGPAQHLVYRTIGGQLEFYFFPGPTPEEVIQQYHAVIGTPYLPAYWAFGFQMSRYGYENLNALIAAVNRTIDAGIPYDVVTCGIDCMSNFFDFTIDPINWAGFPNYTKWVHENGMHLTLAFDPAVEVDYAVFKRAIEKNASFVEWPRYDLVPPGMNDQYPLTNNTKIMLGNVWPWKNVAFPDFLDPLNNTIQWWADEFTMFRDNVIQFDGIWIDMNEPSNFYTAIYNQTNMTQKLDGIENPAKSTSIGHLSCPYEGPDSEWDHPPYETINVRGFGYAFYLSSRTLCMLGTTIRGTERFYNTKNLYGWSMIRATSHAIKQSTGKRGEIISRSTFPSSGHYGGSWLGDTTSHWGDFRTSIVGVQEYNMFGLTMIGSDICGFQGNTTEELCLRWQQMGAFYSFMRNHNNKGSRLQDPGQWPSVAQAAKKANFFRYRHLPYLFSLHFATSLNGGTVVRPVFFEFPHDENTHNLSFQFLWGSALMIIPVVYEVIRFTQNEFKKLECYFGRRLFARWSYWYSVYDYFYGTALKNGFVNLPAPWDYLIPVLVRGGNILPRQRPSTTTVASRKNEFQLLIALDQNSTATGELFWDDGESIIPDNDFAKHNYYHFLYSFNVGQQKATLNITQNRMAANLTLTTLDNLEIFGYPYQPNLSSATLNGAPLTINTQMSSYSPFTKVLNITTTGLIDLNDNSGRWIISWNNS